MPSPILTRKKTPFDGVPAYVFSDLAEFVRRWAPRWVTGSRSMNRLALRRGRQREAARSRRRGYCLIPAADPAMLPRRGGLGRHSRLR